jgi:hypothetical protein
MSGTFCGIAIPNLLATSITFDSVLDEEDGEGELLAGVPLDLAPVGPTISGIAFACQVSGPSCSMEVKQLEKCDLAGGAVGVVYEYTLRIERSQDDRRVPIKYLAAPSCDTGDNTELRTDFTITDSAVSLQLSDLHVWLCSGRDGVVDELRVD